MSADAPQPPAAGSHSDPASDGADYNPALEQFAGEEAARIERERRMIKDAESQGGAAKLWAFTRLSGPGWLQSAITLGGGSLASSLYIGVLVGFAALWWQPLAMIMGVIMLSAISFVTLSTGERPFDAINRHINPVLGWGWAIATVTANLVWCMPQYALGTAAVRQNLAPGSFEGANGQWAVVAILFVVTGIVIWFYDSGGWGVRLFEWLLKGMVGLVVISFFAVVARMSIGAGSLDWGAILAGFVPDFSVLSQPAGAFNEVLAEAGEYGGFWSDRIVGEQRKVMISGAATAVGINMTFLLPYSMLRKGWDRDFRGLAIFDLASGLFIPYLLATSCVVIAAASQFHAQEAPGLVAEAASDDVKPAASVQSGYNKLLDARVQTEIGEDAFKSLSDDEKATRRAALPDGDRRVAAMIVRRDTFDLASALKRLAGKEALAQYIFGVGVLGMAVSTIIILMLINGFVLTEIVGEPGNRNLHRVGCFLASIVGAYGSMVLWTGDVRAWLAVPTSMFGMVLLPIAYVTFFLMLNSKSLMGGNMPTGGKRVGWNILMGLATAFATACCLWSISINDGTTFKVFGDVKDSTVGFTALGAFALLAIVVQVVRPKRV